MTKLKTMEDLTHLDLRDEIRDNATDIEIMKNDISNVKENVKEVKKDIQRVEGKVDDHHKHVHTKMDKLDNRLWWIVGILLTSIAIPLVKGMWD